MCSHMTDKSYVKQELKRFVQGVKNNFMVRFSNTIMSCAFRSLFAERQHSKPMNFGEAGIHRMFRLTQQSPRKVRQRRISEVRQRRNFARGQWDERSGLVDGTSCEVMLYGQGNPRTGGNLRPELVSPRASRPERGI